MGDRDLKPYNVKLRGTPTGPRWYRCEQHGRFELTVDLATSADPRPCPTCAAPCERTVERPLFKPQRGTVVRGKSEEPPPWAMDTTKLADGQDPEEWNAELDQRLFDLDMAELKQKGLF